MRGQRLHLNRNYPDSLAAEGDAIRQQDPPFAWPAIDFQNDVTFTGGNFDGRLRNDPIGRNVAKFDGTIPAYKAEAYFSRVCR